MRGDARIINGKLIMEKKLLDYISKFTEGLVDVELIVISRPAHYLYKYLHGYLLKSMAEFLGDSRESIYKTFKEKFAMETVETWEDIPRRHRRKCQRYELLNGVESTKMFMKSASSMSHEELKEFVTSIENDYFDFCQGRIEEKLQEEAKEFRKKGFMSAQQLKNYEKKLGGEDVL
jgi:hypothetical protein